MQERETQAPEQVNLHERGGLTPEYWQEVISRVARNKGEIPEKVVAYGRKVLSGEFPDSGFHHREFLGRKHWEIIKGLPVRNSIKVPRSFPLLPPKSVEVDNPIMVETVAFARAEARNSYTLSDYIVRPPMNTFVHQNTTGIYELDDEDVWKFPYTVKFTTSHEEEIFEAGHYFKTGHIVETDYEYQEFQVASPRFYERWLFSDDEFSSFIGDKKRISDFEMAEELERRALLDPEKYRERLKAVTPFLAHIHDSPHFGILETPIPQTV